MHKTSCSKCTNVMLKVQRCAQNAETLCSKCGNVLKMQKRAQNAETLCAKCEALYPGNIQVAQNAEASCSKCETLCKRVYVHADVLRKELGGRALWHMRMRIYLVVARPSSVMAERRQPSCNTPYVWVTVSIISFLHLYNPFRTWLAKRDSTVWEAMSGWNIKLFITTTEPLFFEKSMKRLASLFWCTETAKVQLHSTCIASCMWSLQGSHTRVSVLYR